MMMNFAKQKNTHRQRRRGFTLTEIAIVLGIVGLILGAIWVAAAAVYNNLRISHANTAILQTVQAVRTLYATQPIITSGDDSPAMIDAGVVPSDMINGTNDGLTNAWGGKMFIGGTTEGLGILVDLTQVPGSACINLVSAVGGSTRDAGLFLAKATADTGAFASEAYGPALTTPVAPTTAAPPAGTGCVTTGLNEIEFGFLLKG